MAQIMNSITVNTTRNHINGSITMKSKPEVFSSYTRSIQARRPTYWDFKPGYRAVNSPGLHLYRAFSKVAKPWPPVISTHFGDRHVGPQVGFVKARLPAIPPGFELQDKSGNSLPPAILPDFENPYIEPQDKLQSTTIKDGVIYDLEDPLFLPPRSKLAVNTTEASPSANDDNPYNIDRWWIRGERKETEEGKGNTFQDGSCVHSGDLPEEKVSKLAANTTEASPSANDDNPYNIDRWWIRGERKETEGGKGDTSQDGSCVHSRDLPEEKVSKLAANNTEASPSANDDNPYNIDRWWIRGEGKETGKAKGDTFQDGSCVHVRDFPEEKVYFNVTQLQHPQPQRSTSAEVMRLELQARMQTPSLNLAATSPLYCADEDRSCVEYGQVLLHRLRTRLEEEEVEVIDLSEREGPKGNKNIIPNDSHEDPIDSSITGSPQMDLLSSSPCPRLEARDSINNSKNPIVPCKHEVDLISFGIATDPPYTRITTPLYQQTDLLSRDSSPLLRFEANPTLQEKLISLDFHTNGDSGTSFTYQPPRKTLLNQVLLLGLLFFFFVALAKLISKAEGMKLWIIVLALGLGVRGLGI